LAHNPNIKHRGVAFCTIFFISRCNTDEVEVAASAVPRRGIQDCGRRLQVIIAFLAHRAPMSTEGWLTYGRAEFKTEQFVIVRADMTPQHHLL
jgi:hypothetical protein